MCGIFAYSGIKKNASQIVFNGLKRLDYRGYDSWGLGTVVNSQIMVEKSIGKIEGVTIDLPPSNIAIGHTRWATHGAVSNTNAHPHYSTDRSFIVAQNGIVENYVELKNHLIEKKYAFHTQTDTEVIVRLIEDKLTHTHDLISAVRSAFVDLKGRNTIIILTKEGHIIAARNGSPLVVGINGNEIYFSSDTLSFAPYVKSILVLENGQMAVCANSKLDLLNIVDGKILEYVMEKNTIKDSSVHKGKYDHYMIKEIFDTPHVIDQVIKQDKHELHVFTKALQRARNVYCIGSGSTGVSAAQMAFYLRAIAKINAISLIGADAKEFNDMFTTNDIIISPSQSGETADVLEVLEEARKKNIPIASYVNMPGSMMTRLSDYKFMTNAGPEICVMSTKIFVSQLAWGYLVAKTVTGKYDEGIRNLKNLSQHIKSYLHDARNHSEIKSLALQLAHKKDIFLLGKSQNMQIIKEGMIKIIEGSYIHAHAIPAGDLKHYAITLMEKGVPVLFVFSNDQVKNDIINAMHEVKARGATVIAISPDHEPGFDEHIRVVDTNETSAIMNIIPLQLLAYYMASSLGHDVDKPRNIAKSVTVK